jgi:hypothetical protein
MGRNLSGKLIQPAQNSDSSKKPLEIGLHATAYHIGFFCAEQLHFVAARRAATNFKSCTL